MSHEHQQNNFTAWYAVGALTLAHFIAIADRQILTLLVEPIRHDLNISDTQISLLGGFAFAIFYTFFALPIAYLADRKSRRTIIAVGIATWSIMTSLCGFANNFIHLFLARVGVGIGEASLGPAAYSMISDYFPPDRLGRAMGVFIIGSSIGSGMALVFGGVLFSFISGLPTITAPIVGVLKPWQLAFISIGLPGLLVAALMMTVREPLRTDHAVVQTSILNDRQKDDSNILSFIVHNWKIYIPMIIGFSLVLLTIHANLMWLPTFYIRVFGWEISKVGWILGGILLIFGTLGSLSGGILADYVRSKGYADASLKLMLAALVIAGPLGVCMPLITNPIISIILLSGFIFIFWGVGVFFPTALLLVTPNQFRARISALMFFVGNLVGMGLGPIIVALITDYVFADDFSLNYSLSIVTFFSVLTAAIIFLFGMKHYSSRAAVLSNT